MRQEGQQGVRRGDVVTTADEGKRENTFLVLLVLRSTKDRDAADTHVQCQRALLCSCAARATQVHARHWVCVHACVGSQPSCGSRLLCADSFCGRGLRVLTLSNPGQLSARAALIPKGELEHALRPHFSVLLQVSGKVCPESQRRRPAHRNGGAADQRAPRPRRTGAVRRGQSRAVRRTRLPAGKPLWLRTHTDMVAVLVCVVLHCDTRSTVSE